MAKPKLPQSGDRFTNPNFKRGFVLTVVATFFFIAAFGSPYWLQTYVTVPWDFKYMGLWEVCLDNYLLRQDSGVRVYDGCYWVFSQEMDTTRNHWTPNFFVTAQVFSVIALLLLFGSLILCLLILLKGIGQDPYIYWIMMMILTCSLGITALLTFISSVVVGVKSGDRDWHPRADFIWLSWSYAFNVATSLLTALAAVCFTLEVRAYWGSKPQDPEMFPMYPSTNFFDPAGPLFGREADAGLHPNSPHGTYPRSQI